MSKEDVSGTVSKSARLNKKERSWVYYDVGMSAFTLLSTVVLPIYFATLIPDESVVVYWGAAETIAALILALLMPILGSLADFQGYRVRFFIGAVATGVVACMGLALPLEWLAFLVIYVVAALGLNGSNVFYDAFLVDATSPNRFNKVSSSGYAWGYIGSVIPFALCLVLIMGGESFGIDTGLACQISALITGVWWVLFTIPLVRNVKQTHYKPRVKGIISKSFTSVWRTFLSFRNTKVVLFFLLAYFCYIDGVHTIIRMATSVGTDLGVGSNDLLIALLVAQIVAFPSAIIYGKLADKFGTRTMITVGVIGYLIITIVAAALMRPEFSVETLTTVFYGLAVGIGLFQGGIQAISRSYFGKLVPKERANEYFGFFDIFGKYAAIMGTGMMSLFTALTGSVSLGILSIAALFVLGLIFLAKVPKESKEITEDR